MRERDTSIDVVKGVAIIIVMIGHCFVWNQMAQSDPYIYDMIATVQMPLFMAVSGYLAGLVRKKRTAKEVAILLGRRSVSYLVPFFVWPLLFDLMHPITRLKELLFQLDTGLWFLMTLWIVTVIAILCEWISYLLGGNVMVFVVLSVICYAGFFVLSRMGVTLLSPQLTVSYMPFYIGAYAVCAYLQNETIRAKLKTAYVSVFAGICGVIFVASCLLFDMQNVHNLMEVLIRMGSGVCGVIVIFYSMYHIKKGKLHNGLAYVGNYTLELYVCQYAMHDVFVKVRDLGDATYSPYSLQSFGVMLMTFVVMCLFSVVLIGICRKVWILNAVLFGKKRRIQ